VTVTSQRPRRQRRRRPVLRALVVAATLGAVFALGVALGQSIATDQTPEGATTQTRTIVPVAATRQTVTVTTTVTTP
jgi:ferric-dicitrate binding protein FerR (iron transport regulator)